MSRIFGVEKKDVFHATTMLQKSPKTTAQRPPPCAYNAKNRHIYLKFYNADWQNTTAII